jgi:hypothetical protein
MTIITNATRRISQKKGARRLTVIAKRPETARGDILCKYESLMRTPYITRTRQKLPDAPGL